MINKNNTVYIIQYDFDLNGKTLSIPEGCILWFQGGTINNGNICLHKTPILGIHEFKDKGSVVFFGDFKTGQVIVSNEGDRTQLKWWNGTEWILFLDSVDYNELKSIINTLIEKHNKDISNLDQRVSIAETNITNINNNISKSN